MTKKNHTVGFDAILIDIAENGMALREAIKGRMSTTVFYNILQDTEKQKRYARACEIRSDTIADEIMDISDNVGSDMITLKDGREVVDNAVVQRDRLRVDSRKWLLAKLHPRKYGDKIELEHSGGITLHFDKDDEKA